MTNEPEQLHKETMPVEKSVCKDEFERLFVVHAGMPRMFYLTSIFDSIPFHVVSQARSTSAREGRVW